ncbi:MAG: methylenetetrahydrofolate--tRNA-(uracil(54)-C(5))-methyltransferase (FADH(2)-oxidizing) TrmFO [Eubacteriaceae bacterium]|nr:methylenetetrahydrofolate--tRNA-(uracil(54)-C(5))-methyltransferase (FADH(2)-oxidizing) TrmFO [Eubacteriaceae bacterium]
MININVIGAGLAGCEAAWQAASCGAHVTLYEMKPEKKTPAHRSDGFCELVCSNSLRSAELTNAGGLLKEELLRMGSLVMEAAYASRVSAGGALAVDRDLFSGYVTEKIRNCPSVDTVSREITSLDFSDVTVVATGPLTSDALAEEIKRITGDRRLYFYDAAAPIVDASTVDMKKAFFASRYGKGTADYVNCPFTEEEYKAFYRALLGAETAELHDFEKGDSLKVFEGCMPVEVMASRGEDTLRYGPMKPVGIRNPETGETYYAVVQLRKENEEGTMYNIVGFQTHLTWGEQKRVFRMIPGLENAEFLRYGVMHRNTFLDSPSLLDGNYSMRDRKDLFFAGQMTGVEGYIESCASGFVAGINAARRAAGLGRLVFPPEMMTGAMARYISTGGSVPGDFQPMNANFGIMPPAGMKIKGGKKSRAEFYSKRALDAAASFVSVISETRAEIERKTQAI